MTIERLSTHKSSVDAFPNEIPSISGAQPLNSSMAATLEEKSAVPVLVRLEVVGTIPPPHHSPVPCGPIQFEGILAKLVNTADRETFHAVSFAMVASVDPGALQLLQELIWNIR